MIVRAPRPPAKYTVIANETVGDQRLTWAARGLLLYLLSKPDHWRVSVAHLQLETQQSRAPSGRDAVYALLTELEQRGYITRQQARADGGRMGAVDYVVHETPQPLPAQPDTANPQVSDAPPLPAQPYPADPPLVSTEKTVSTEVVQKPIATRKRATQQALALRSSDVASIVTAVAKSGSKRTPMPQDDSPVLIDLPTNLTVTTGETVPVCESVADALQRLYPATNARAELHAAHDWLTRRVADRKTAGGMLAFLHSWLGRAQNQTRGPNAPHQPPGRSGRRLSSIEEIEAARIAAGVPQRFDLIG